MKRIYSTPLAREIVIDVQSVICDYSKIPVEEGGTDPKGAKEYIDEYSNIW